VGEPLVLSKRYALAPGHRPRDSNPVAAGFPPLAPSLRAPAKDQTVPEPSQPKLAPTLPDSQSASRRAQPGSGRDRWLPKSETKE
jgi:hypothetical protein